MLQIKTHIGKGGRLVIPAGVRRAAGLREGDEVSVRVQDGVIEVVTFHAGVRKAQALLAKYMPKNRSLADELIAERRKEALRG